MALPSSPPLIPPPSLLESEITTSNVDDNYKLVPWLNWDEWDSVRLSLFSSSPHSVATALRRIAAWRSRGCVPVTVEVTAAFVEIQQRDPYFSGSLSNGALESEELLSMLYTSAVIRLVNGVIEKTRKRQNLSIAKAAEQIELPRTLIDIRHEGSHRDLNSVHLLRRASITALNWLKSYYWDQQKNTIPYRSGKSAKVRIRSRLRELACSLKLKHSSEPRPSLVKAKCATIPGRNKLFSLVACQLKTSKVGPKKQMVKTIKKLVQLYSFYSSDAISVLLEFLLRPSNSTDLLDSETFQINPSLEVAQHAFDEWKPVITKLSKKEPDLLFGLLMAVLDMIETRKISRDDFGSENFSRSLYDLETQRIGVLSSLFSGLMIVLKSLNLSVDESQRSLTERECYIPRTVLVKLVKRCLHVADPENNKLLGSALVMAKMVGNSYLNEKIQKLSLLSSQCSKHSEEYPSDAKAEELINQDKYIIQAAEKLEMLKRRKVSNSNVSKIQDPNGEDGNIWTFAKSWNPCPIGMLPRVVGSSGFLPVLDYVMDYETKTALPSADGNENSDPEHCNERDASCDTETVDVLSVKRMRDTEGSDFETVDESSVKKMRATESSDLPLPENTNVVSLSNGVKGRLLIGGFYQKVGAEEPQNILSRLRVLVPVKKC